MSYDAKTERLIALKKLAGKAQTSNDKGLANEALPSGITSTSETIFGEAISTSPSDSSLYTITGKVEYIRFPVTYIAGSDTSSGRHGFELKLPSDYESNSSNSKAGTYPFQNNQSINITSGSLQLVPPSFASDYEAKPYYGGTSAKDSGTQIPLLDARDWYLDYFNGIFFQQDPSGTGDQSDNPDYVEAFLYIGNMLDTVVTNAGGTGGGDPNAQYLVLQATSSLSDERVFNPSTGISVVDGGAGGNYTLSINNAVVATLTGSQFSGNVGITGSLGVIAGLSGSLTKLTDGTSYLIAGSNSSISTGSSGAVTISSIDTTYTAGDGLDLSGTVFSTDLKSSGGLKIDSTELAIDNSIVATLTGSQFSDNIGVTGSIEATSFFSGSMFKAPILSGSLTKLHDGTSYLIAGNNIQISTGSSGAITITGTATGDITGVTAGTGLSGGGSSGDVTLNIDNSVVATLSGSQFSGNVGITGSLGVTAGISGSLTKLTDGTSYLIAGSNVTITTGSSGAVTITAAGGIDGSGATNRIATWADSDTLTSDSDLTWDGTTLYASSGGTTLNVQGDTNLNGTVVINQSGVDKDFRVETQNKSSALQVDGGTDMVLLFSGSLSDASGHGSSAADPNPRTFTDTNFFVSGSIDSRGTSTRGTAVFGGDTVTSGTISFGTGSKWQIDDTSWKLGDHEQANIMYQGTQTTSNFGIHGYGATKRVNLLLDGGIKVGNHNSADDSYIENGNFGIGTTNPSTIFHIKGGSPEARIQRKNQTQTSALTFAGASNVVGSSISHEGLTNDLVFKTLGNAGASEEEILRLGGYYSSANRQIILLSGSSMPPGTMQPKDTSDITFFVSGAINSIGTSVRGTSVFGGDMLVSGALVAKSGISGSLTHLTDGTSYLIAGSNVTITTGSSGAITIASSGGGSVRSKFVYELTASHPASENLELPNVNFSSVSYDSQKIDVFVNGQLMTSGSGKDYLIPGSVTGSVNFTFGLLDDDIVATLLY